MDVVLGSKRQGSRIRPDPGNNDKSIALPYNHRTDWSYI